MGRVWGQPGWNMTDTASEQVCRAPQRLAAAAARMHSSTAPQPLGPSQL